MVGPPRPRPVAEADPVGREGRHGHRVQGRAARRPRRLRRARRRRCAGARRVHVQRDLQVPGLPVQLPDGADQQDLDRRLPRRRAARRRRTPSSGSWTSSPSRSASTRSRSGRRTGSSTRSSRSPRWPAWTYDSGNYEAATARAKEMFGYDELRAEQKRRRESGDRVQLGIGVSTFTEMCGLAPSRVLGSLELRRRRLGARERADAGHRQGRGRHRCERPRPGPRDGVQPDRGRPARRGVRGRRGAARRHPAIAAQGPRHLRLAVAGRRRRGAGPGGRQGDREGEADRGPPARGQRRRHRVLRRPVLRQGHRPGSGDRRRSRWRRSPRTTTRRASSRTSTPRRPTTRSTSTSRTAPTCARWRSTPRPARSRCASTSAATTSATSSTR